MLRIVWSEACLFFLSLHYDDPSLILCLKALALGFVEHGSACFFDELHFFRVHWLLCLGGFGERLRRRVLVTQSSDSEDLSHFSVASLRHDGCRFDCRINL